MRPHTSALDGVLTGSFGRRLIVDVFHGSDRQMQNLDVTGWSIDWDMSGETKMTGRMSVVYASQAGESLVPDGTDGILSPFKARLLLLMEIFTDDGFSETITLGWARVTSIPSAQDVTMTVPDGPPDVIMHDTYGDIYLDTYGRPEIIPGGPTREIVVGSVVELEFKSLDVNLVRRGFRFPEQVPDLSSCYGELRRITGMPVTETLPDKPIPTAIVYEASRGGRLKGVQDIAAVLGGVAVIDSVGAVKVVPVIPGEPVGSLVIGPDGTVTDVGYSVDTEGVYNTVVGSFETEDRQPLWSVATVSAGNLAIGGDYDEYTLYFSTDVVKTQVAADEAVQTRLATVIASQSYEIPIKCVISPLPELGDVLTVEGWRKPAQGMLTKMSMSDAAEMDVVLKAARVL